MQIRTMSSSDGHGVLRHLSSPILREPIRHGGSVDIERGVNMGREEKRLRERATKLLTKKLQREPTEEEIDKEIERHRKAQGLTPNRDRRA